ncbi:MAG: hypothetical protein HYT94_05150 [Parcubacteria group bacterium]|nr:hypothetical protein [Parcubacteria group bacterium]
MKKIIIGGIIIFALVFGLLFMTRPKDTATGEPGKLDAFAQCLTDKGVKFYGAFWCPHCQAQKKLFGSSEKLLPYVECSTPDAQSQTAVCKEKKIEGYPTWEFADGSRESGEVTLEQLSEKSSCPLPPQ